MSPRLRDHLKLQRGITELGGGQGLVKSCQTVVMFLVQSDVLTSVTFLSFSFFLFFLECLGWMCKIFVCASLEF